MYTSNVDGQFARATALSPDDRYRSVHALADDVRRFQRGEAVRALPEGPLAKTLRFMSRHRRTTLGVVIAVIVVAAADKSTSLKTIALP